MDLQPNDVVDRRYRVVRKLGRGAYGSVYEVVRVVGGVRLALKVLHPHLSLDEAHERRFVREAALVERLDHPNIVKALDVGKTESGMLFVAFEFLGGYTVGQLQEQAGGRLDEQTVVDWIAQLLGALAYAHSQGVVHRDIKPGNLMIVQTPQGDQLKILDFGVAKAVTGTKQRTALTAEGMTLGSPYFLAPEQVRGEEVDGRADLYAVGLMMVHLLTGQTLVAGDSQFEMMLGHLSKDPHQLPAELQRSALAATLTTAFAKDPRQRFATAEQMLASLHQAAQQQVVPPQAQWSQIAPHRATAPLPFAPLPLATQTQPSPDKTQSRPRTALWAGGLALVAVVLLITVGVVMPDSESAPAGNDVGTQDPTKKSPGGADCVMKLDHHARCQAVDGLTPSIVLNRLKGAYKLDVKGNRTDATYLSLIVIVDDRFTLTLLGSPGAGGSPCTIGKARLTFPKSTRAYGLIGDHVCLMLQGDKSAFKLDDAERVFALLLRKP